MSLESIFLNLYVSGLQQLTLSWMASEEFSKTRFNFQVAYLLALIPDPKTREEIEKEQVRLTDIYRKKGDPFAEQRSGFIIVSKIVDFLCSTFDLVHSDITGQLSEFEMNEYEQTILPHPDGESSV